MSLEERLRAIADYGAKKEATKFWRVAASMAVLEAIHDLAKLINPEKAKDWPTPEERFSKWNEWVMKR